MWRRQMDFAFFIPYIVASVLKAGFSVAANPLISKLNNLARYVQTAVL